MLPMLSTTEWTRYRRLNVGLDPAALSRLRRELHDGPAKVRRIVVRAVNKIARKARTKIIRAVTGELNLTQAEVRNRNIRMRLANYETTAATITVTGRRIPLRRFGARQTRRGVSYAIRRGKRQVAAGSFLATMPSGHAGVMRRKTTARLPIAELYGPSVPVAMEGIAELSRGVLERALSNDLAVEIETQKRLVIGT